MKLHVGHHAASQLGHDESPLARVQKGFLQQEADACENRPNEGSGGARRGRYRANSGPHLSITGERQSLTTGPADSFDFPRLSRSDFVQPKLDEGDAQLLGKLVRLLSPLAENGRCEPEQARELHSALRELDAKLAAPSPRTDETNLWELLNALS